MKSIFRKLLMTILFLNSVGALAAGYLLMTDPSGSNMGLSLDLLQYSSFSNFFIPGLILFIANGILSGIVFILTLIKYKNAYKFILAQGILLSGWIFGQILILRMIHPMHFVLGAAGVFLIYLGSMNARSK